ncbi:AraC family transcriptional regulator [Mariniflexile sp. AS56]|uniref:AraC family transcriptional regulator n=1 Tax=Mariniflexile sp. AS56 TaxID=3063957 RepID=UPI0026E9EBB3|nr:helix-turn-helix transcriptional regulator [Mariniflexile sp. AS56]MDO7174172.1 helix-turn-helix transcriptional regulator [Mariniflexile sp. AS56]
MNIPILHIGQFEQDVPMSDFYSNDLPSHLHKNKNHFDKPHRHNFFLCVLFTAGTGTHDIDFNSYPIKPGSVFFLTPGQTHFWKFDTAPQGYIFFHTPDFYELHFSKSKLEQFPFYYVHKNSPNLELSSEVMQHSALKFKEINQEFHQNLPYKKQKIASLINTVYIDLARQYTAIHIDVNNTSVTYLETLRVLEKVIETHYKTEKSAQFYANALHVSPKHLNRIIKTILGKTTTHLITERVILEAKRYIVHSGNALSNISEILGYSDYAYFSKVFKLKTGLTPLGFKKKYR